MVEKNMKTYKIKINPDTLLENGQKCSKLPKSLQSAPLEELNIINTINPSYPWVLHPQVQPTVDQKYLGEKYPRLFQKAKLKYATC